MIETRSEILEVIKEKTLVACQITSDPLILEDFSLFYLLLFF
jgi:hypothetical protein